MSEKKEVYNLEFPSYIFELNLAGYVFRRVENYEDQFLRLQHLVDVSGSEFRILPLTGTHAITATVEFQNENLAALEWGHESPTQLDDIILLLDLFTGRSVFYKNWDEDAEPPIIRDSRLSQWGAQLRLSSQRDTAYINIDTREFVDEDIFLKMQFFERSNYHPCDIGFEKTINSVIALISSSEWQTIHQKGYFLFLYKNAVKRQTIEYAFLEHWTIWEHLFALHNSQLSEKVLETTDATMKIIFILEKYFQISISATAREEIKRIKKARHALSHFGKIPTPVDIKEMELFIRLTEQVIAVILGLTPSNTFNSREGLDAFLKQSV